MDSIILEGILPRNIFIWYHENCMFNKVFLDMANHSFSLLSKLTKNLTNQSNLNQKCIQIVSLIQFIYKFMDVKFVSNMCFLYY